MSLAKLRAAMQTHKLDAVIISNPKNRFYVSGFTGSAGLLLITQHDQLIVTDSRYYEQVRRQLPDWHLIEAGYQQVEYLRNAIETLDLPEDARIGFESNSLTVAEFQNWEDTLDKVNLVGTSDLVLNLRAIKTEKELDAIRQAVTIADGAMAHIYRWIQPGMTEKEVAWELEVQMRQNGASALSFETIVASGPNSALPHAQPSDRVLELGDIVVIDMGCVVEGYASDVTRTFSLGEPKDPEYFQIWQLVCRANRTAVEGVQAGLSGKEADALARDIIKTAGYGDYFGHSLGHGVGLDIHEYPRLSYTKENILATNSVVTIEPGVYLPGRFGVRLEDMVLVLDDGVEVLTGIPKILVLER